MFRNATTAHGLNVARVYAHTTDPDHVALKKGGKLDEDAMVALDYVLDEARRAGLKVIVSLLDNWKYQGGVDEMVDWSKTAPKRTQRRPGDASGDFDDQAWGGGRGGTGVQRAARPGPPSLPPTPA